MWFCLLSEDKLNIFQNNDGIDVKQLTSQAKMFCFTAPACKVSPPVLTRVSWLILSCFGFGFVFLVVGLVGLFYNEVFKITSINFSLMEKSYPVVTNFIKHWVRLWTSAGALTHLASTTPCMSTSFFCQCGIFVRMLGVFVCLGHETRSSGCLFWWCILYFDERILICNSKRGNIKRSLMGIVTCSLILKFKFYQKAG